MNVGVHSFLRIISSLPFLFLSLPFHLSFSFPPNRLPDEPFARFVYIPCLSPTRATLSFYSASRPVIVDTTVQNGCFTPPLARELGNKLAAGLISLSRLDTATLPLETSRDRCPKPSNRCLDTVSTVSRRSQDQWLFSFSFLQVVRLARYHVISSTDRRTGLR